MAIPQTREQLKQYCLRNLGHPVIEVNVDDDQLEDRIDEAIQIWNDYHYDGAEKIYLKHQVTATDIINEYISVGESIKSIIGVFPIDSTSGNINMFDVRYQLRLNDIFDLSKQQLSGYTMAMQHLSLIENLFNQSPSFRFNRHSDKIYLDIDWDKELTVNKYLLFECYKAVDPEDLTDAYNDLWLKKYVTAIFKRQWGSNLLKYEGMQLPGGTTLNGRQIFDDATTEIQMLDDEIYTKYQLPDDFIVG
tara:strand:- start:373 stop:1116 length:744 start_codon:yes stop_codon:yes gene_type:complete